VVKGVQEIKGLKGLKVT
jgi:hypothetical protein